MRPLNRELGGWFGLVIVTATVFEVACSSKSSRDADWEEVQKAAIRVESGLRHETLIALRSKVADLDAAVANYTRQHPDGPKEQRVRSINQAVDALEWGIDHEKSGAVWDGSDGFDFYTARRYLNAKPLCAESEGKVYVDGHDLSVACLAYAQSALLEPDKAPSTGQYDFSALRSKCRSDHEDYQRQNLQKAEASRAEHLRKWPLQVDITATDEFDFEYEIDGGNENEGKGWELRKGMVKHIDARHTVRIFGLSFVDDYKEAVITVNGRPWNPTWRTRTQPRGPNDVFDMQTTIELGKSHLLDADKYQTREACKDAGYVWRTYYCSPD